MPMNTPRHRLGALAALAAVAALTAGCGAHLPQQQAAAGATSGSSAQAMPATQVAAAGGEVGRDWSKIDTDRDNNVSPAEMEAWLKANPGPLAR